MATLMTRGVTLPRGMQSFPALAVPIGVTRLTAQIDRTPMAAFTGTVSWQCDLSLDGGVTWSPWGAAGTIGGALLNPRTGLPVTTSSYSVILPDPTNVNRMVRGSLTTTKPLVTTLTIMAN